MINISNLSKSFNDFKAINNVDLNIKKGEIFGLLGPNGAGKSTLINILSTVLKADIGTISLNGMDLNKHPEDCKQIIGIVPQEISLYDNFSAYDNLLFFGKLYGVEITTLKNRINELLILIGLDNRKNDLIKTYSGGMKRRINIAAALLHQPEILLMDEPTVGVDPQSRNQIFDVVEALNKKGMTIIYTTHYMEEVERLCDTIAIMDSGKIIIQGTLEELQNTSNTKELLQLKFKSISKEQIAAFKNNFDFEITNKKEELNLFCNIEKDLNGILNYSLNKNLIITAIHQNKATLETIFLKLTGKNLRD
ncbi:MAG TPA: ABC transporter ATP-binding protein [Crocinitomix sp.]|nr:ABC transporter ATP-binding protein [Crocinitomix sp.]